MFNPGLEVADSEDGHLTAGRAFPNEARRADQNEVLMAACRNVVGLTRVFRNAAAQRAGLNEVLMTVFQI